MWEALYIIYAIILIATIAASFLMRPKGPPPPKPATLDEIQVPLAEEGKELTVVFGTVIVEAPNVVYYGNLTSTPVRKKAGGK